jgi:hypothetical protein
VFDFYSPCCLLDAAFSSSSSHSTRRIALCFPKESYSSFFLFVLSISSSFVRSMLCKPVNLYREVVYI